VTILPPRAALPETCRGAGDLLLLTYEPWFWSSAVSGLGAGHPVEVEERHGVTEPFAKATLIALWNEAQAGYTADRTYAEALAAALAVHMAQHHRAVGPALQGSGRGLPHVRLQRVLEFIDAHLEQDLSLKRISSVAGLSPFHFARLFRQSMGVTAHQHILRRRVEHARDLLQGNGSVADVARQVGFCDQSHLSAHFKRVFGVPPRAFFRTWRHR
jgi:AraC family transcriptional regulator